MNRRRWMQSAILTPAALAVPAWLRGANTPRITVTGLEIFRVKVNRRGNWILTRIQTSAGITGIGDASHGGAEEVKLALIRLFFEHIKGRSIYDIEHLRTKAEPDVARQGSAGAVALSGIEQCLWDIRGQAFGVPICDLMGGRLRSRIRNYANINRSTDSRDPAGFAQMAGNAVKAGFDAIKMASFDGMPRNGTAAQKEEHTRLGIECIQAVRKAIGPRADLLVDAHSNFDVERGLDLARRLEPMNLFWLEEVTPSRTLDGLARINREVKMPTAGGESIYGVKGFYPYFKAEAVDIAMPDVKYCGGILELKKIAALAEAAGMPVSPHGPASPVGNMAAAHVCAAIPNFQILEFSFGEAPWRPELVDPPEELDKGFLTVPDRPGLGIKLNENTLKRYQVS